jgi:hypothetical protein
VTGLDDLQFGRQSTLTTAACHRTKLSSLTGSGADNLYRLWHTTQTDGVPQAAVDAQRYRPVTCITLRLLRHLPHSLDNRGWSDAACLAIQISPLHTLLTLDG